MLKWAEIDWSALSWAVVRVLTLLGLLGGAGGGSYYLAADHADQQAQQVIEGRQQEALGTGVLLAEMKRQIARLEDEQDRMKDQLRALWRKVGKPVSQKVRQQEEEDQPEGGYYVQQDLQYAPSPARREQPGHGLFRVGRDYLVSDANVPRRDRDQRRADE